MAPSRWNSAQAAFGGQDNRIIPEFSSRTGLAPSLAQPPPHARSHILAQAAGCGRAALPRTQPAPNCELAADASGRTSRSCCHDLGWPRAPHLQGRRRIVAAGRLELLASEDDVYEYEVFAAPARHRGACHVCGDFGVDAARRAGFVAPLAARLGTLPEPRIILPRNRSTLANRTYACRGFEVEQTCT